VFQAADRLAEALQHSPEWEEWAAANAALERDDGVATLRARVQGLSAQWQLARSAGGTLPEGHGLAHLQRTLQGHPVVIRQQEPSRLLVSLFQQTNDLLSSMLEVDFAASAVRRSGGCCGS
jgi:cell fate (sporulation/competence/biofilm development) regulator YlbF (YheA/YmcA/DUF963 family)